MMNIFLQVTSAKAISFVLFAPKIPNISCNN